MAGDLQEGQEEPGGYQEIRPHDSVDAIIHNVTNNNIQSIRNTVKVLDKHMVEQAIEALGRAERIFSSGSALRTSSPRMRSTSFCGSTSLAFRLPTRICS